VSEIERLAMKRVKTGKTTRSPRISKSIAMNKLFFEMTLTTNFPAGEGWAGVKKLQP
jgi:hypothetical protein